MLRAASNLAEVLSTFDEPAAAGPHAAFPVAEVAGGWAPAAPADLAGTGIAPEVLADLVLKFANASPTFTADGAVRCVALPRGLVGDLLEHLRRDKLVEILGEASPFNYRFAITERGRARAVHLLQHCGYIGPAPVPLEAYAASLEWQLAQFPPITGAQVQAALAELVLAPDVVEIAGLAAASGRSLFLYGPPGNGKTTLGHVLHGAFDGNIWIPHCIGVGSEVICVYDAQHHHAEPPTVAQGEAGKVDRRWVRIRRPFIVAAGEMSLDQLELAYSAGSRFYQAPMHLKANGGIFLLDDFGRQRVAPQELIKRWIFPLERGEDYLTLHTGQKLRVPFRQMLILSTNLEPRDVMDGAFLRRLGYRLRLDHPTPEQYAGIFTRYAKRCGVGVSPGVVEHLLERYREEQRPLHSCEPRDLIERARDICLYRGAPLALSDDTLDLAWKGYFGERQPGD
jgi:predicted ATPase with chaperone activity